MCPFYRGEITLIAVLLLLLPAASHAARKDCGKTYACPHVASLPGNTQAQSEAAVMAAIRAALNAHKEYQKAVTKEYWARGVFERTISTSSETFYALEWDKARNDDINKKEEMDLKFREVLSLTQRAYGIEPTMKKGIVQGGVAKNEDAKWAPRIIPEFKNPTSGTIELSYYKEKTISGKKYHFGQDFNSRYAGISSATTLPDGEVLIPIRTLRDAVRTKRPAWFASTVFHESTHFTDLITTGWDTLQEGEVRAHSRIKDFQVEFGLDSGQIKVIKQLIRHNRRTIAQIRAGSAQGRTYPYSTQTDLDNAEAGFEDRKKELNAIASNQRVLGAMLEYHRKQGATALANCRQDFLKAKSAYERYAKKVADPEPIKTAGMTCRQEINELWRLAQKMSDAIDAAFYRCQQKVDAYERKWSPLEKFWGPCEDVLAKWRNYEWEMKLLSAAGDRLRRRLWLEEADKAAERCGFRRTGDDGWRFQDIATGKAVVIRHSGVMGQKDMESLKAGFLIARTCLEPGEWWSCNEGGKIIEKRWAENDFRGFLQPSDENDRRVAACMLHVAQSRKLSNYGELKSRVRKYFRAIEEAKKPKAPSDSSGSGQSTSGGKGGGGRTRRDRDSDLPWCMQAPGRNCVKGL